MAVGDKSGVGTAVTRDAGVDVGIDLGVVIGFGVSVGVRVGVGVLIGSEVAVYIVGPGDRTPGSSVALGLGSSHAAAASMKNASSPPTTPSFVAPIRSLNPDIILLGASLDS